VSVANTSPSELRLLARQGEIVITDDVDLTDESELYGVIAEVEAFLQAGRGVRVSILTGEQWLDALERSLSKAMRRGAERHRHVLVDRQDPHHLLVSPSAVAGVNDRNRVIYAELVFHVLRCIPTTLSNPLRRGLDDILAQGVGERLGVNLFTRNFPDESELVASLLVVLAREFSQFGYQPEDWARLLRRDPDKFFYALERSKFAAFWVSRARQDPELAPLLAASGKPRQALIALLRSEDLSSSAALLQLTTASAREYAASLQPSTDEVKA